MTPEQRFERIETILQAMAERQDRMEIQFNARFEASERRMDRMEKQNAEFQRQAEARMAKFDRQLLATKRLVDAGMKIVGQLAKDTRELKKSQKAFLDSLRGRNGNGHRRN